MTAASSTDQTTTPLDPTSGEPRATALRTPPPLPGARPWLRVAAALFAIGWGGNEFTPLLGMYRAVDGLGQVEVDLLLASYVLGIIPALLVGGPASDRLGRRALMVPAPIVGIVGSLMLAVGDGHLAIMFVGRLLCGIALGLAMAVGSSWVAELSIAPFDTDAGASPARRSSLALTAGFGLGAAVAAVLAQYGPARTVLPYAVDVLLTAFAFVAVLPVPETRHATRREGSLLSDLAVPGAMHHRFRWLVLPCAPWVFGCAAVGYAILPALAGRLVGSHGVLFAGLLCLVCLGCGFAIQPLGRRLDAEGGAVTLTVGMVIVALGMLLAVLATLHLALVVVVPAAAVLGCGYGLVLVASLQELQHIAGADDLAGLTAVFYSLAYVGFFVPMVLAIISHWIGYQWMFGFGALAACVSLGCVVVGRRLAPGPTASRPVVQSRA